MDADPELVSVTPVVGMAVDDPDVMVPGDTVDPEVNAVVDPVAVVSLVVAFEPTLVVTVTELLTAGVVVRV